MTTSTAIIIAVISLIFSALFSGSEIAFITADRVSVELGIKKGGLISNIIDRFYDRQNLFITTILVGNNIMLVIYGMGAAYLLNMWFIDDWQVSDAVKLITETLISTFVVLLVGEFFPKATFRINPFKSLKLIALPIYVFYILLWPVSKFTEWLSKSLMKLMRVNNAEEEIQLISIGELNQYIEQKLDNQSNDKPVENEVNFFHNAIDFSSSTKVRDCMIPRNEFVAVNIDTATADSLRELFTKTGRSKILLFHEDIDDILGYIHVSELLVNNQDWKKAVKPVLFVPESYSANKLMRRLLSEKRSIAIAIDEFGGTSGLVTLEDLVEEIFGNIEDEHDKSSSAYKVIDDQTFEIEGKTEISLLNDELHLNIPEDDEYLTIAGYLISNIGNIPEINDVITLNGIEYTILKKSATRIELVKAVLNAKDTDSKD